MNVLLLSGYWPVVGTSVAIALPGDRIWLIVPQDEEDLARQGWADEVITFQPGSLTTVRSAADALRKPLRDLLRSIKPEPARIGMENGEATMPATYAANHLYGSMLPQLLHEFLPHCALQPADDVLRRLRSLPTPFEMSRIGIACSLAERAFDERAARLRSGLTELQVANLFRKPLSAALPDFPEIERADGYVSCMSGPNSALAGAAYARSRTRSVESGDLVLVHCNSYADGFWTDITRTYSIGAPDDRASAMRDAVFAARAAALKAIAPGREARNVDAAARSVLRERGFESEFTHSTGHGVGFSAIDADAPPRLHPASEETLEEGMVFNVEPAVYFKGYGGLRHCDMVAITPDGAKVLTPFQCDFERLILRA